MHGHCIPIVRINFEVVESDLVWVFFVAEEKFRRIAQLDRNWSPYVSMLCLSAGVAMEVGVKCAGAPIFRLVVASTQIFLDVRDGLSPLDRGLLFAELLENVATEFLFLSLLKDVELELPFLKIEPL